MNPGHPARRRSADHRGELDSSAGHVRHGQRVADDHPRHHVRRHRGAGLHLPAARLPRVLTGRRTCAGPAPRGPGARRTGPSADSPTAESARSPLTLAIGHPDTYPTFLDISGEDEPSINPGQDALTSNYSSGDASAFAAQNPLHVIAHARPAVTGIVTVGADDSFCRPQGEEVAAVLQDAGMGVRLQTVSGGHTWEATKAGLQNNPD